MQIVYLPLIFLICKSSIFPLSLSMFISHIYPLNHSYYEVVNPPIIVQCIQLWSTDCQLSTIYGSLNHPHSCTVSSTVTGAVVQLPTDEDSDDHECYCDIVAAAPPARPTLNGADPPQYATPVTPCCPTMVTWIRTI